MRGSDGVPGWRVTRPGCGGIFNDDRGGSWSDLLSDRSYGDFVLLRAVRPDGGIDWGTSGGDRDRQRRFRDRDDRLQEEPLDRGRGTDRARSSRFGSWLRG